MDLKNEFIAGIRELLQVNGFEYQESGPYFTHKDNNLSNVIGLDISSSINRYAVTPNIFIRSDSFAQILKSFEAERFKEDHYFTVRTNQYRVAELYGRPEYKVPTHVLKDELTLKSSIENFKSFMRDVGFTFFGRFKTLADFDEWFNGALLKGVYDFKMGNSAANAKEGLIAAKLNRNAHYEKVYALWIEGLTKEGKYSKTIETLNSLKIFLDNYPMST